MMEINMSNVRWNNRVWLNSLDSHYSGSIVTFDGTNLLNRGKKLERYTFIEISDCHGKVRIHKDDNLDMRDFIEKLRLLETEIREFRLHLEYEQ